MTFGTPDLLISGGHFNHPCCGATGRLQFQQYRKYIFALPSSAWEPSGQSAAPTGPFRSCTCRWARVPPDWGAYHRIICTHTVSLLYIRDIGLAAAGIIILPVRRFLRRMNRSLFVWEFQPNFESTLLGGQLKSSCCSTKYDFWRSSPGSVRICWLPSQ